MTGPGRDPVREVLVLRALGVGDLLTAVPALRGLRAAHPAARLTLAAPAALTRLALLTGAVDRVVDAAPLAPLPRQVHGADLAVNLHGRGPQSTALLRDTGPRRLVAWAPDGAAGPAWRDDEHEVARWCRLLAEGGIPADPTDLRLARPDVAAPMAGAVVVHPGAALPSRRWPATRWGEVARALSTSGVPVVVTGGPDEVGLAREVAERAGLTGGAVLAGRTGLLELAALIADARLLVSPDTGVAHLATALGTPSVVLFGPASPALWGPPAGRARHRVLWSGRTGDPFAAAPDPGLLTLTPADVLAAAGQALAAAA